MAGVINKDNEAHPSHPKYPVNVLAAAEKLSAETKVVEEKSAAEKLSAENKNKKEK